MHYRVVEIPELQVKLLQLIDIAVQRPAGAASYEESNGIIITDVRTDADAEYNSGNKDTPETVLLRGASGLSMNDLFAFASTFIWNGGTDELRTHAKNILISLVIQSSPDALHGFFEDMATICPTGVAPLESKQWNSYIFWQSFGLIISLQEAWIGELPFSQKLAYFVSLRR